MKRYKHPNLEGETFWHSPGYAGFVLVSYQTQGRTRSFENEQAAFDVGWEEVKDEEATQNKN